MSSPTARDARVLVLTHDDDLAETVLAAAAAVDVPALHERDPALLSRAWRAAVVGADLAPMVARQGPGDPATLHLVGRAGDEDALCGWSAAFGAAIAVLPDGVRGLSASLAGATGPRAVVLGVVGGVGGAGASTLAVGLADLGARRGLRTLLVDLDPFGGGLDLALGLEQVAGWRWSGFAAARGFVGDLAHHLPSDGRVAVLAWDRDPTAEGPEVAAISSVVRSAARTHDLVVVDLARSGADLGAHLDLCDGTVVVTPATVRGLAGARTVIARADPVAPLALVTGPGPLAPDELARGLGVPLLGRLPRDSSVGGAADRGEAPGRAAGRSYRRSLQAIGTQVLPGGDDAG